MKQVILGSQGLRGAAIGLGCMGMSDFYGPASEAQNLRVLDRALDIGCTFWDTRRIGERQVPTQSIEQSRVRSIPLRRASSVVGRRLGELVVELPDGGDVHPEDQRQIGGLGDPGAHQQIVTHEEAFTRAERQRVWPDRHLFPALEDQAQDGFVQRGLERARVVLLDERQAIHRMGG